MADKQSPPWLLGVFTFALLSLVFASLARTRGAPIGFFAGDASAAAPLASARHAAPRRASGSRTPTCTTGVAVTPEAPLFRSAVPAGPSRQERLNTPVQGRPAPAAQGTARTELLSDLERDAAQLVDEGRNTLRPTRLNAGARALRFRTEVLPWVTECAFVLCLGIILGFLHRVELIVVLAVSAVFAMLVGYLEWREYTDIHFAGLWAWSKVALWNPVTGVEVLHAALGKLAAVGIGVIGWVMGTKG